MFILKKSDEEITFYNHQMEAEPLTLEVLEELQALGFLDFLGIRVEYAN